MLQSAIVHDNEVVHKAMIREFLTEHEIVYRDNLHRDHLGRKDVTKVF